MDALNATADTALLPPKALIYVCSLGSIDFFTPPPTAEPSEAPRPDKDDEGAGERLKEFVTKDDLEATRRMLADWKQEKKTNAMGVINWVDNREMGFTPFIKAAYRGNVEICKVFLAEPLVLVNKRDENDKSALCHACEKNHTEVIKIILARKGLNPLTDEEESIILDGALISAVKHNHVESARLLVTAGANVNESDSYGFSPLAKAVSLSHSEMAKLLISYPDVDVNQSNKYGTTPLHYAALQGNKVIAELLLTRPDIIVNKGDRKGQTPLRVAAGADVRALLKARGGTEEANCSPGCATQ